MNLLGSNDLKEQHKKLTRQKILLGSFMIELLETNKVEDLAQYTMDNLGNFLTKQGDKELMNELISILEKQVN